jgi:hypothetical protein
VSDVRAEALLRSALEKIVYFEARSGQLEGDAAAARAEVEQLKAELASAGAREVTLRQRLAELDVSLATAHRDREELGRVVDVLRNERATQLEKLLDAARIRGALSDEDGSFDLAAFISQLRSEVLAARGLPAAPLAAGAMAGPPASWEVPVDEEPLDDAEAFQAEVARQMANGVWDDARPEPAPAAAPRGAEARAPAPEEPVSRPAASERLSGVAEMAESLHAQGRLGASRTVAETPRRRTPGDATLFGFSIRELSAPDPVARIRAAERLGTLRDRAAASGLAAALHAERDPAVAVALLEAFRALAGPEGAAVVEPFVAAPYAEVRIAALRALVALDAGRAVPQLQRAARDEDPAVRRRATLLGLQLPPREARALELQQSTDADPEVRRVSALAVGAAGGQAARGPLLTALDDPFPAVRQAAARSLSRLLGVEVDAVASLEGPQRRREIRRLMALPLAPVAAQARSAMGRADGLAGSLSGRHAQVAVVEEAVAPDGLSEEALCAQVLGQLQTAMRGSSLEELVELLAVAPEAVESACVLLTARGQVVRRGKRLFVA